MKRSTGLPPLKLGATSPRQTPTLARLTQKGPRPRPSQSLSIPSIPKTARAKATDAAPSAAGTVVPAAPTTAVEATSPAPASAPAVEVAPDEIPIEIAIEDSVEITEPIQRESSASDRADTEAEAAPSPMVARPRKVKDRPIPRLTARQPAGAQRATVAEPKPNATPVPRMTRRPSLVPPLRVPEKASAPAPAKVPTEATELVAPSAPPRTPQVKPAAPPAKRPPPTPITARQIEEMEAAAFELDESDRIVEDEEINTADSEESRSVELSPATEPQALPLPPVPPTPATPATILPGDSEEIVEWTDPIEELSEAEAKRLPTVSGELNAGEVTTPAMFSSIAGTAKPRAFWPWLLVALLACGSGTAAYLLTQGDSGKASKAAVAGEAAPTEASAAAPEDQSQPQVAALPLDEVEAAEAIAAEKQATAETGDAEAADEEATDDEATDEVEPAAMALPTADDTAADAEETPADDDIDARDKDADKAERRRARRAKRRARAAARDDSEEADESEDEPAVASEPGTLMLSAKPPCSILIDGENTGLKTPQRDLALSPGRHKVTLVNDELGIKESLTVRIQSGATKKVVKDLTDQL